MMFPVPLCSFLPFPYTTSFSDYIMILWISNHDIMRSCVHLMFRMTLSILVVLAI
jgi:hypothetical protein